MAGEETEDDHTSSVDDEQPEIDYYYKRALHDVQENTSPFFWFGHRHQSSTWTIAQWNALISKVLLTNTSVVESITVELHVCPVESLLFFVDCIPKAHKNLKSISIEYKSSSSQNDNDDSTITNYLYRSILDDLLFAIRQNSSIQELRLEKCMGKPQSMQNLLAGNESLTKLELVVSDSSKAMARSIANGLKGNKSLKHIRIFVHEGSLDVMVSGLCHRGNSLSSLESLTLWTKQPETSPELGPRVLEAIKCCPSLKTLVVDQSLDWGEDRSSLAPLRDQSWIDHVLKNLHHPECTGLETLRLQHLTLGTSSQDGDTTDHIDSPDWIVPAEQANKTLKDVTLDCVTFASEQTARLLLNLRGLTSLHIAVLSYLKAGSANNKEAADNSENHEIGVHEEACKNNGVEAIANDENHARNIGTDYWAQFFRQCTDLREVYIEVYDSMGMDIGDRSRLLESVFNGARGHKALEKLFLSMGEVEIPGGRLRVLLQQLLFETTCLKHLTIDDIGHHEDLAAGLAGGLRGNKSLQNLRFKMIHLNASDVAKYITIIDSLLQNDTLQDLSDDTFYHSDDIEDHGSYESAYNGDESHDICMALTRVFRVNKSLRHIVLPSLDLRQGRMHGLLDGLGQNTTLTSVDMSNCQTDAPGFALLEQALVDNKTIPLKHIVLPCFSPEHSAGSLSTDIRDFFQSLVRMRHVQTVNFCCTSAWPANPGEDRENCLKLLWRAVKENKYIQSFGFRDDCGDDDNNESCSKLMSDIKFHLSLNRFGRHGLDSTNFRPSLWPAILAPIGVKNYDADALFFFIREYFLRHSYPLRRQQQQRPPTQQELPLPKRARLDGDSGKKRS